MKNRYEKILSKKSKNFEVDRKALFKKIDSLLNGKSCGILLLSELDKKDNDKVSNLAFNCDKIHSNLVISYLISNLPGIKKDLEKIIKSESNNFVQMVS